jgi:hypothetical protein
MAGAKRGPSGPSTSSLAFRRVRGEAENYTPGSEISWKERASTDREALHPHREKEDRMPQKLSRTAVCQVTVDTAAAAYSDGDQLGTLREITDAFPGTENPSGVALGVTLVDKSDTKPALDILLFSQSITPTSADNGAASVTDALLGANFLGHFKVEVADWQTILAGGGGNAVATISDQSFAVKNVAQGSKLYALFINRTAVTHVANGIIANFGFLQD